MPSPPAQPAFASPHEKTLQPTSWLDAIQSFPFFPVVLGFGFAKVVFFFLRSI